MKKWVNFMTDTSLTIINEILRPHSDIFKFQLHFTTVCYNANTAAYRSVVTKEASVILINSILIQAGIYL